MSTPVATPDWSVVPTTSRACGDSLVEAVVSPADEHRLSLEIWDGHEAVVRDNFEHDGIAYVPPNIQPGLLHMGHFPPASQPFSSAQELISRLREFFTRYAFLLADAQDLLTAFVLASWFVDCVAEAPILHLVGPDGPVRQVLGLLAGLCRYPIRLGDADFAALATLPPGLGATLLIDQRHLTRGMVRVLQASRDREFRVHRGSRCLDIYGARVFARDTPPPPGEHPGLTIFLPPAPKPLRTLHDGETRRAMRDFQAQLLRYRMAHRAEVCGAEVENLRLVPSLCDQAQIWLTPRCGGAEELGPSVLRAFSRQSRVAAGERFSDEKCLALEAALSFCHKPDFQQFFIGDAAKTMNDLLRGRHEEPGISSKRAGALLSSVGLVGERVTAGYRITLSDAVRERIHELANAYQILPVQDGVSRCRHCSPPLTP